MHRSAHRHPAQLLAPVLAAAFLLIVSHAASAPAAPAIGGVADHTVEPAARARALGIASYEVIDRSERRIIRLVSPTGAVIAVVHREPFGGAEHYYLKVVNASATRPSSSAMLHAVTLDPNLR